MPIVVSATRSAIDALTARSLTPRGMDVGDSAKLAAGVAA
jgi:hypothetical protein